LRDYWDIGTIYRDPKKDRESFANEYVVKQVDVPAAQAAAFCKLEDVIIGDEKSMAVLKKQ